MAKNSFLTALLVFVAVLGAEAQNKVYKTDTVIDGNGNKIINVYSAQTVTIHDFEMSLAGAGSLVCEDLHADHVELGVAGSGSIVIEAGTVKNADISVAGTGSVETRCELESMDYNISGWGNIYYYGDVKVKGTCMLGRIKRIDEEK